MILLITAIHPEATAVLSALPMKRKEFSFPFYESDDCRIRLLITGPGKLAAAMAVTAYLTAYPAAASDVFCNVGICGGSGNTAVGDGFFCSGITEATTGKSLYPELYGPPVPEAMLITSDTPITAPPSPEGPVSLPLLYDMEGFGVAAALFRIVQPSHCFFYKVVSDLCDGSFPSKETVDCLIKNHLPMLLTYLTDKEISFMSREAKTLCNQDLVTSLAEQFMNASPFSATMERKLRSLITYGVHSGFTKEELLSLPGPDTETPHKKKASLARLQQLEHFLLASPSKKLSVNYKTDEKKILHPFRHIYVEQEVFHHPNTRKILEHFPKARIIPISHYKDVFNRSRQDLHSQETEPALILASNRGKKFYPGAPVCQSFGEEHFMYTSCIMNCLYDCDYCYLQGMYPSGNLVVFVNLEDYFSELDGLLRKHPVYLCCSYDSDLTALNGICSHAEAFCDYALQHPNLRLELRTKSAALPFVKKLPKASNIILAFTLSPERLITQYEHYTPSLVARLSTAKQAAKQGLPVRLCFDPILDIPNAEEEYSTLVEQVFSVLHPEEITDISLGVFRLSCDYLKQLRKAKPACAISHYPYETTAGVCHYPTQRCDTLLFTVKKALLQHGIKQEQIFIWAPEESREGEPYVN